MGRHAAVALLLVLAPRASAQSLNLDFGEPAGMHGLPSPGFAAAGKPGIWHAVTTTPAANLVDIHGQTTSVSLHASTSSSGVACDHAGTSGDFDALLDDRLWFDAPSLDLDVRGLAAGRYRVHVYALAPTSACPAWDPLGLRVRIGAASARLDGAWSGALVEGETHATLELALPHGGDLRLSLEGTSACCASQLSGLQLERLDDLASFCFGDGGGAPCPCGNDGQTGRGCANTNGAGCWLEVSGTTQVALDDLRFIAHALSPGEPALLFVGREALEGGLGTAFGDGLRCVGNRVVRLGVERASANGFAFFGPGLSAAGGWQVGDTRRFQAWYRDTSSSPCGSGFNLSQGVEAYFLP